MSGVRRPAAGGVRRPGGHRLTVRSRLALTFSLVFLAAGAALIAITVSLARKGITDGYNSSAELQKFDDSVAAALATSSAPSAKTGSIGGQPVKTVLNGTPTLVPGIPSAAPVGTVTPATKQPNLSKEDRVVAANRQFSQSAADAAVHRLVVGSSEAAAALIPIAALLGWLLAGRALHPVRTITGAARRVSAHQLSERLAVTGPRDEITELAGTFDAMMDRLESAFDAQRRFVANASHELRTPLAVAGTAVDVVLAKPDRRPEQLDAMAHDVRAALRRAELLVESLLALTRSQHLDHASQPVDLATLAEDALDTQARAIADRGITVDADLDQARTRGDRSLLDRLVANLVDNAVRHNLAGGRLRVATRRTGAGVELHVTNTGPVIGADQLPRLLEPFQRRGGRAHADDPGLGLGLTIVDAIVTAHAGQLSLAARPAGGLDVTVALPADPTDDPTDHRAGDRAEPR